MATDLPTRPLRNVYPARTDQDVTVAAKIIADAFHDLPASAWLVPDESSRHDVLTGVFAIAAAHALDLGASGRGGVDLLIQAGQPDVGGTAVGPAVGAAVWFDQRRPVPAPVDYAARLQAAAGQYAPRFAELDALFAAHHPPQPHYYLALLGVVPPVQGSGAGSALLAAFHAHLGVAGRQAPGYLEAASSQSRQLYLQHGYTDAGDPFPLTDDAMFFPMMRS